MKNRVIIDKIHITKNRIIYGYQVEGDWVEAFNLDQNFFIEYNVDISDLPQAVAIVPLLANLLPMSWVYDAEIVCDSCDKAFYESIPHIKQGYINMYPSVQFGGKLTCDRIEETHAPGTGKSGAFFSGGVDAFHTLISHEKEKPALITLWGADVKLDDTEGWGKVSSHIEGVAESFGLDFIKVKSSFRLFLKEQVLDKKVEKSKDMWWHGFHHGIGIICHAAPICYMLGIKALYIASSFHISQKGQYTCASDPTIDNFVKFVDADVVHDGYEFTRQNKIEDITQFSKRTGKKIQLRVCWVAPGGTNCCSCEKCFRTIMGIYAQGCNPHDFGFDYTEKDLKICVKKIRCSGDKLRGELRYGPIQTAMRKNIRKKDLPKSLRWFYTISPAKIWEIPLPVIFLKKVKNKMKALMQNAKK